MDQQKTAAAVEASPDAPRLTMRLVMNQMVERFFDVEKGWLRTALELTLGPGTMIRRYVEGHRKVYANPFAYLILGTAVSFIVQRVVGFQERMVATTRTNALESPLQMEFINSFTELMMQNGLYVSIGILLPLALLVRIFFWKSGYNLAECLVFALYTVGHLALLGVVLVPLLMLLPPSAVIQGAVGLTVALIYVAYAGRGFFSGNLVVVAIKTSLAYAMAYLSFLAVMMVLVFVYVIVALVPTSSGVDWDLVTATDYEVIEVIEKLLDEGVDINMTLHRTALHAAAENGNLEIVELLIARGADLNLQDNHGRIPMYVALANYQSEIAKRLAEEEFDVQILAADGSTLLMAAARAEDVDLVRWALDRGIEVNAIRPKKNHATALMIAAGKGNPEIVELLLARGADPDLTNHEDRTALDLAKSKEVKDLLRATAANQPFEVPESAAQDRE
jgi:ankyrin repeat protein